MCVRPGSTQKQLVEIGVCRARFSPIDVFGGQCLDAWLHEFLVRGLFFLGSTPGGRESPTWNFHSWAFFFEPMQTSLQSLVLDTFVNMGRSCDGTRLHYTVRSAGGQALVTPEAGVLLGGWNKMVYWGLKLQKMTSFLYFQSCQQHSSMNLV